MTVASQVASVGLQAFALAAFDRLHHCFTKLGVADRKEIPVKFCLNMLAMGLVLVAAAGCSSPAKKIKDVRLGMTPEEVLKMARLVIKEAECDD